MSEHLEGTIVLDGMLEGRLPDDPDVELRLREWIDFARGNGLPFTLDIAGNAFSVLPDNKPVDTGPIGDPPEQTIRQAIEQLLEAFPHDARRNVFSTLRSSAYRPGEELQSVYLINPLGEVDVQSRAVDAKTVAPLPPLTTQEKVKTAIVGVLIAAAIIGVSSFFIDFRGLIGQVVETITPLDADAIHVDAEVFDGLIRVSDDVGVQNTQQGKFIVLTVDATEAYPTDAKTMQAAYDAAPVHKRLALDALARGYVRYELFDENNQPIDAADVFFAALPRLGPDQPPAKMLVRIPQKKRIGKIKLTY